MKSSFEDIRILVGPHKKSSFEKFGGNYLKSHFLRLLILVVLNGFTLFVGWFEKLCCKCDCGTKSVLLGIISTMDFIYPNRYRLWIIIIEVIVEFFLESQRWVWWICNPRYLTPIVQTTICGLVLGVKSTCGNNMQTNHEAL